MAGRKESDRQKELEIHQIMTSMCVSYTRAVELHQEFNRIDSGKDLVFANI
jgi:hypothetical protein